MAISKSLKKALIILVAVIALIAVVVAGFNIYFAVIGSKKQVGQASGYHWSAQDSYDNQQTKVVNMGEKDFKILVLTDIHYKNKGTFAGFIGVNYILDWAGQEALDKLVKKTAPDLILILGDSVLTKRNDIETARLVKKIDSYKLPWACVFGNHDDEGRADKNKLVDELMKSQYGLFSYGPKDMHGAGNYVIELMRGETTQLALFMFDSGSSLEYKDNTNGINQKQVDFYNWNMAGFNQKLGKYPGNMAFFHIPLPIYTTLNKFEIGQRKEDSIIGQEDAGLIDAMTKLNGSHILVGHDHSNNFIAKTNGIKIGYAMKSSYNCYYKSGMTGGTLLTIDVNNMIKEELIYF